MPCLSDVIDIIFFSSAKLEERGGVGQEVWWEGETE